MTGKCADCLVPQCLAGACVESWKGYAVFNNKLYCFMIEQAKEEFMQNIDENINLGNKNWNVVLSKRNAQHCMDTDIFMTNC